jgi:hypothetical protein
MAAVGETDEARADMSADADERAPQTAQEPDARTGMTPRQARRLRAVVSAVVMVAVAVTLVVRLEYGPSLVMVGLYGVALILCGTAIVLSRRGRTRVATAVLAAGFAVVVAAEVLTPSAV